MCNFKPLASSHHSHTDHSLDGAANVETKILYANKINRIADCVTDHGTMSAIADHYMTVEKLIKKGKINKNFKSIHGIELYIVDPHRPPKKVLKNGTVIPEYYHLTIHFKNFEAYKYFCQMTIPAEERAIITFGERKPMLTFEDLEKIAKNIIISSGCLVGCVQKNVLRGRIDLAEKMYLYLRELAGPGNFFAEVMPHSVTHDWVKPKRNDDNSIAQAGYFKPVTENRLDEGVIIQEIPSQYRPEIDSCTGFLDRQALANKFVINMAKKYNDPIVLSMDDHFSEVDDQVIQNAKLGNGREDWKFYSAYAMYTSEQAWDIFKKQNINVDEKEFSKWIDNSYMFVDQFDEYKFITNKDRWLLPSIQTVYGDKYNTKTSKEIFWELTKKYNRMPDQSNPDYQEYIDRVEKELSVICDNPVCDFLPYFFVLEDVCDYARQHNMLVNVRGSAGGSLVLFLLGISVTNPLKYGLIFERFLTIGRILSGSLPDVDTDWPDRSIIINYLIKKYGYRVALISTKQLMKLKNSILDVERSVLGRVRTETQELTKQLAAAGGGNDLEFLFGKEKDGNHIPGFLETNDDPVSDLLREWIENNKEMWDTVLKCIGVVKTKGIHAGGVVITDQEVQNYFPTRKHKTSKACIVDYDMHAIEYCGGIKYDFLGVDTLQALEIAMKSVKEHENVSLEWIEWEHDQQAYDSIIDKNLLAGVFQVNTDTMSPFMHLIKPKSTAELSDIIAGVRPGALNAPSPDPNDDKSVSAFDYYIKCSRREREPYYIHPDLEPILSNTYGMILYQEDSLNIFREIGGYTYEEAEGPRKGIGKKIPELLNEHGQRLKTKCLEKGWTEDQADRLFESIIASSAYSFNKSHTASCAVVANNCIYMKYNYPEHYWRGMLTIKASKEDDFKKMLSECDDYVLDIDIYYSDQNEFLIENKKIRPPLSLLKGAGESSIKSWSHVAKKIGPDASIEEYLAFVKTISSDKAFRAGAKMGGFLRLLLSGCMDRYITFENVREKMQTYHQLYEKMKKIMKSSAGYPKKKDSEFIGLCDIKTNLHIDIWNWQTNFVCRVNFFDRIQTLLSSWGYHKKENSVFQYQQTPERGAHSYITNKWFDFFKYANTKYFQDFCGRHNSRNLQMLVIIVKSNVRYYGNGKKRLVIDVFNGRETIRGLTLWPDYNTKELNVPLKESMQEKTFGLLTVKPNLWNNKPSGAVVNFEVLFI